MQYIYGTDTVQQGFNKVNENFLNVPSGTTEEILQQAQTQAQEYTDSVISNPNLIINGDFQIWQRGESFATDSGYIADRWKIANSGTVTAITHNTVDGGVHFSYSSLNYINCVQFIENIYGAQQVTLTAMVKGVEGKEIQLVIGHSNNINTVIGYQSFTATGDWQIISYTNTLVDDDIAWVNISARTGCTDFYIKWAKLELGSISTQYVPRSTGEELLLCQRYYRTFPEFFGTHTTFAYSGRNNHFSIMLTPTMRVTPTANFVNCKMATTSSSAAIQNVTFNTTASTPDMLYINAVTKNTTPDAVFVVNAENGLTLDAEIY